MFHNKSHTTNLISTAKFIINFNGFKRLHLVNTLVFQKLKIRHGTCISDLLFIRHVLLTNKKVLLLLSTAQIHHCHPVNVKFLSHSDFLIDCVTRTLVNLK